MGKKKRGTTARNNNNRTNNHRDTPMTRRPEYIPIHLADIPEDDIHQYNLREIANEDGYVYCERSDPRSSNLECEGECATSRSVAMRDDGGRWCVVPAAMGKTKRGKRKNSTAPVPHHRVAGHDDEQCDTILNSKSDEADKEKEDLLQKEVFPPPPPTTTITTLSVGDIVTIKGLISAPQYNGMKGIIVSELDVTTNRCGVRVTGKNAKVMAIQVINLTFERRAKKSMIGNTNVDRVGGSMGEGFHRHLAIACTFCDEDERLTLVEQNMSFLEPAKVPFRLGLEITSG